MTPGRKDCRHRHCTALTSLECCSEVSSGTGFLWNGVDGASQPKTDVWHHGEESHSGGARLSVDFQMNPDEQLEPDIPFWIAEMWWYISIPLTYKFLLPAGLTRIGLDCVCLSESNEWNLLWHCFTLMQQKMVRICMHRVLLHNLYNDDDYGAGNIWESESNWQRMGRSTSK